MIISAGQLLLWAKLFYYLRMLDSTNYLARMVVEVIKDMQVFLLLLFLMIIAFSDAFYSLA
jgi:hypothetical protein